VRPGITKAGLRPRATQAKPEDGVRQLAVGSECSQAAAMKEAAVVLAVSVAERQVVLATHEAAAAGSGRRRDVILVDLV